MSSPASHLLMLECLSHVSDHLLWSTRVLRRILLDVLQRIYFTRQAIVPHIFHRVLQKSAWLVSKYHTQTFSSPHTKHENHAPSAFPRLPAREPQGDPKHSAGLPSLWQRQHRCAGQCKFPVPLPMPSQLRLWQIKWVEISLARSVQRCFSADWYSPLYFSQFQTVSKLYRPILCPTYVPDTRRRDISRSTIMTMR